MEFLGRVLGIGAAILAAVIFFIVLLAMRRAGVLDDAAALIVGIFRFLIIDLGGLLVRLGDALISG
jgi:hypothetical protein